jgi:hypothetical protein
VDRVNNVPGVQSAAITDLVPMDSDENLIGYSTTAATPPANQINLSLLTSVSPDYLKATGIRYAKADSLTSKTASAASLWL